MRTIPGSASQGRGGRPRAPSRTLESPPCAGAHWTGKLDDWTWAACGKLQARMVEIAGEFIKANPTAMDLVRREYRDEQCNARRERIAQLRGHRQAER
jgi:hypothetical protein